MRKSLHFLLALTLLLFTSVSALAQQGPPPPPPPPATDYSPKNWIKFSSTEGRFEILFPDTPKESITPKDVPEGKQLIYLIGYESFITYSVLFTECPPSVNFQSDFKRLFDIVEEGYLSDYAQFNPRIVKKEEIAVDGNPGRFIQTELGAEGMLRSRLLAVKNRFYQILVITPRYRPNTMGAEKDYEEIAMSFLNSFKLTKQ